MIETILYKIAFYLFSALTVGTALIVVFDKNIVRSAFALFFTLCGVAGLFVLLGADFLAGLQILLYAGGILVLILFGVMMTHKIIDIDIKSGRIQIIPSIIASILVFMFIFIIITKTQWKIIPNPDYANTTNKIGHLLLSNYILPFEIASVALLAALIGAVYLARREKK
jgi:NADH-quinone oxidoreductase subunit J